jgi:hypothetical protein
MKRIEAYLPPHRLGPMVHSEVFEVLRIREADGNGSQGEIGGNNASNAQGSPSKGRSARRGGGA